MNYIQFQFPFHFFFFLSQISRIRCGGFSSSYSYLVRVSLQVLNYTLKSEHLVKNREIKGNFELEKLKFFSWLAKYSHPIY